MSKSITTIIPEIEEQEIAFKINGREVVVNVKPSLLLIDLIRDGLLLKGTKPGCLEGECGACTVLIDGNAVNSCMFLAVNAHGRKIITIEGLSSVDEPLDSVQKALVAHGAVQCGFCSPGMTMSIKAFKAECDAMNTVPTSGEIKKAIEGNLCRCTGYVKIVEAVESLFEDSEA